MTATLSAPSPAAPETMPRPQVTIIEAGMATTLQDLGRPGLAHLGITESGGADRSSLTLANRLVGNADGAAVLECTMGSVSLALSVSRYVAVTGATASVCVNGRVVNEAHCILLRAGDVLGIGRPLTGLRTYVAIAGGIVADAIFGSSSTDCLSGLGPAVVRNGAVFDVGVATQPPGVPNETVSQRIPTGSMDLSFRWGPRDGLFAASDLAALTTTTWTVSSECDRVGVRLAGQPLAAAGIDIPSEGMALGSIQIPPSGQPIIFLADHPVTGGYAVIGVVTERDVDLLAQAAPGTTLRLRPLPRGGTPTTAR